MAVIESDLSNIKAPIEVRTIPIGIPEPGTAGGIKIEDIRKNPDSFLAGVAFITRTLREQGKNTEADEAEAEVMRVLGI